MNSPLNKCYACSTIAPTLDLFSCDLCLQLFCLACNFEGRCMDCIIEHDENLSEREMPW